jgi:hypothetical protein
MTCGGELYQQPTPSGLLALRAWIISESESGYTENVPTPNVPNSGRSIPANADFHGRTAYAEDGKKVQVELGSYVKRVPSPSATDGERGGTITENMTGQSLPQAVKSAQRLPTPTVDGLHNAKGASETSGDGLSTAVKRLAAKRILVVSSDHQTMEEMLAPLRLNTPTAQDAKCNGTESQAERDSLNAEVGGPLNPEWVEWLMGWPIGWTGLAPLAMDRFQQWWRSHGGS